VAQNLLNNVFLLAALLVVLVIFSLLMLLLGVGAVVGHGYCGALSVWTDFDLVVTLNPGNAADDILVVAIHCCIGVVD
jgi:hypothetical protein